MITLPSKNALVVCCLFVLISCGIKEKKKDFYSTKRGAEKRILPLIKPYRAISYDNLDNWKVTFNYHEVHEPNAANADSINVIDSVIVIKCNSKCFYAGNYYPNLWVVLIPKHKTEEMFLIEEEFRSYLTGIGIQNATLRKSEETFMEFEENDQLPWRIDTTYESKE
ncbi:MULTISPECIES: hypothetical protein [Niastella]|uniref:Uncharacterized protein n=1 Tax=Niastella soli TaxID=2821487 RepID=A0ABS3YRJ9_9BACT|nr:hypothetical protein [Niastella soli]MBO9200493.1 hypothetical protein [Niastella soli]